MIVRELELDLDAFEGPFDLLLSLVLRYQQDPGQLADVIRLLAVARPPVSLAHMGLRFPPVAQFVERFRSLLRRRRRFDFDAEVEGLPRVEIAVAFLALLELCRAGEIAIDQVAPFAPIRISRA